LSGDVAFQLHDTWGFPIDLTQEIALEAEVTVDTDRFDKLMHDQRERARSARTTVGYGGGDGTPGMEATYFTGFEHLEGVGKVVAILEAGEGVPVAEVGHEVDLILDQTVFYAEGGGQVGDRGTVGSPSGAAEILDTRKTGAGVFLHRAKVITGEIAIDDELELHVDPGHRVGTERAHTATHVLHWILRDRLGDHARQAGSLVEPGRLRFDFNHFDALAPSQLADISTELQDRVLGDDQVRAYETSYDFARSIGAMAIFGEKYGDYVRVVEVGDYSKELCGGTHVPHTSQIGVAVVTGEGSVGANLRRVEALVGREGLAFLEHRVQTLDRAAELLKATPDEVAEKLERLLATHKDMERRLAELDRKSADSDAAELAQAAVDVDGTRLVVARRDIGVDALRSLAQTLKSKLGSGVIVLGAAGEGRANLVGAVTKDLAAKGISARDLLAGGAKLLGGGAGGKPELAISGGPSADKIDEAIDVVAKAARDALAR
jgi:alanyl-tRNA synthetase